MLMIKDNICKQTEQCLKNHTHKPSTNLAADGRPTQGKHKLGSRWVNDISEAETRQRKGNVHKKITNLAADEDVSKYVSNNKCNYGITITFKGKQTCNANCSLKSCT